MSDSPSTPGALPLPTLDARFAAWPERLFSPQQIAAASLLGTPIAGALLASANLRAQGRRGDRALVLVAALVVAAVVGADAWGAGPLTLIATPVWTALAWLVASAWFGPSMAQAGARPLGAVVVAVAGVWLALGLVGGAMAASARVAPPSPVEITSDAVLHTAQERVEFVDAARREDAARVAAALARSGYFTGSGALSVTVDRADGQLRVTVVLPKGGPDNLAATRLMIRMLAAALEPAECVSGRLATPDGTAIGTGSACAPT